MKIIIAGGRDFNNYELLRSSMVNILSLILPPTMRPGEVTIVSGGARGADTLGERYAHETNMMLKIFPAEWDKYGKSAGYRRNELMAEYGNVLVACWDGQSRGTKHMIDIAKARGLRVFIINY